MHSKLYLLLAIGLLCSHTLASSDADLHIGVGLKLHVEFARVSPCPALRQLASRLLPVAARQSFVCCDVSMQLRMSSNIRVKCLRRSGLLESKSNPDYQAYQLLERQQAFG